MFTLRTHPAVQPGTIAFNAPQVQSQTLGAPSGFLAKPRSVFNAHQHFTIKLVF